jgi:hypothetical protein
MADDWRVTATVSDETQAQDVLAALREHSVDADLRARFGDRVAVSAEGSNLFLYADAEATARAAENVVQGVLRERGVEAEFALDRWHTVEERWEDASVPLPQTAADTQAEHERREQAEAAESDATGVAEWEVRVELSSHADERELAERLEHDGWSVISRWKYLIVGAANQDDALALAKELAATGPAGAEVHVEPGGGVAWEVAPNNPFAIFGGLAG